MPLLEIDRLHARYEYARIVQGKASRLALMAAKSSACPGATAPTRRQRCEPSWAGFAPPEGRIVFNGEDIGGLSPDRIFRKGVAFIPEDRRVFATLTVEENLTLGVFTRWQMRAEQGRQLDRVFDLFPRLRERRSQLGRRRAANSGDWPCPGWLS